MLKSKFIVTLLIVFSVIFLFNISSSFAQKTVGTNDGGCTGSNCQNVSLSNPLGENNYT